jgi:Fis family transcriptional regulator
VPIGEGIADEAIVIDGERCDRGTYQGASAALLSPPDVRTRRRPLHGRPLAEKGHVVNAAIPLRADTAHEASLQPALRDCVVRAVRRYLADVESEPGEGLHALVMREVESPLLREVMGWYGGNQSRAAAALGINRATLRKKLQQYGLAD